MAAPVDKNVKGKPPRRYIISSTTQKTVIEEYRVTPRYLKPSTGSCHDSCKHATDEWMELKNTRNLGPRRMYAMTTSRYLTPKTGSCHDSCKHGKDEMAELKTTRTLASRKRSVTKNNGVKRTVVSVERKKITEIKPKPIRAPKNRAPALPVKVIKLQNSLPSKKVNPSSSTLKNKKVTPKNRSKKPASPRHDQNQMTKTKLRLMIADKITEMILQEAENAELGVEEKIESPETLTSTESTVLPVSESSEVLGEESSSEAAQSSSNEQVSNSETEQADEEEVVEEEYEYTDDDEEGYIIEDDEDDDDDEDKNGRRNREARSEDEDDSGRVKFRRGRVLDVDEDEEAEKVNLKHQEVEKKEAQELLNSVIEETASKLVEDMKTKVGALVGAFETVISLQDDAPEK